MLLELDFSAVWKALPHILGAGLAFTVKMTLVAGSAGLAIGCVVALMRLSPRPLLQGLGNAYSNLFRAIPLVLGLFAFYILSPYFLALLTGSREPIAVDPVVSAYVTYIIFESAYFSEIVRAGIRSIPPGQFHAARALGMNSLAAFAHVILPQALRRMLPVLLTQFIVLFQDTSLVYVLSLNDLFGSASKVAQRDGRLVEFYLFIAFFYFLVSFALSGAVRRLQSRLVY